MKKRIFRYFLLLLSNLFLFHFTCFSQENEIEKIIRQDSIAKMPVYRGLYAALDIYEPGSYLLGGDFLSSELSLEVNLKHKFFPVIELGYGWTNATEDSYQMHYRSSAPFGRIGLNYNTMSKNKSESFLYVGLRYGFTAVKYDVYGPPMKDSVWEGELPFEYYGEKSQAHWGEFLVGVKAHIYKNFLMGWSIRYKFRFDVKENLHTSPWYLPGYGKNKSTTVGITYNLIYKLPF